MANSPELRTIALQWNSDFARQLGGEDPRKIVGVRQTVTTGAERGLIAAYAGDESGDRMAVVVSGTPAYDFNRRLEMGERAVVACAPLEGDLNTWNIGVAEPSEQLGMYGEAHFPHTAVAVPVGAAGLRLWIGRLRMDRPGLSKNPPLPIIDATIGSGLSVAGELMYTISQPLPGIPRVELPRLCPGIVIVESPVAA